MFFRILWTALIHISASLETSSVSASWSSDMERENWDVLRDVLLLGTRDVMLLGTVRELTSWNRRRRNKRINWAIVLQKIKYICKYVSRYLWFFYMITFYILQNKTNDLKTDQRPSRVLTRGRHAVHGYRTRPSGWDWRFEGGGAGSWRSTRRQHCFVTCCFVWSGVTCSWISCLIRRSGKLCGEMGLSELLVL